MVVFSTCSKCNSKVFALIFKGSEERIRQAKEYVVCQECDIPQPTGRKNRKGEDVVVKKSVWHRIIEVWVPE